LGVRKPPTKNIYENFEVAENMVWKGSDGSRMQYRIYSAEVEDMMKSCSPVFQSRGQAEGVCRDMNSISTQDDGDIAFKVCPFEITDKPKAVQN